MSLLADILREIPLSTVLREKIATIDAENAALQTENAILKDHLREAKAQTTQLSKEIDRLTHIDENLDEIEVALLRALTNKSVHEIEQLAGIVGSDLTRVEYHLEKLIAADYVSVPPPIIAGPTWYLEHKGREYLIAKPNLVL
ncbi:MAG: hypothetical protein ACR2HX_18445 [Pyrinomonadaceae bacterium]